MGMYNVPTDGCNLEIMGIPFYAEKVSPSEAFRRREVNFNNIVGGTQKVNNGAYVGLEFSITTHVHVDPDRPDIHNSVFQEMMSKPVEVISPEVGGRFNANVIVTPEHERLDQLKLTIKIKEIPDSNSLIPGEEFTVPAARVVEEDKKKEEENKNTNATNKSSSLKDLMTNGSAFISTADLNKRNKIIKKFLGS